MKALTSLIFLLLFRPVWSQPSELAYQENINIYVNSHCLLVGEELLVSLFAHSNGEHFMSEFAYIQLVNLHGEKVMNAVVPINDQFGEASLYLPASLKTGDYHLISYTKWMLNGSNPKIAKQTITIINPYKPFRNPQQQPDTIYQHQDSTRRQKAVAVPAEEAQDTVQRIGLQLTFDNERSLDELIPLDLDSGQITLYLPSSLDSGIHTISFQKRLIFDQKEKIEQILLTHLEPAIQEDAMGDTDEALVYAPRDTIEFSPSKLFDIDPSISHCLLSVKTVDFHTPNPPSATIKLMRDANTYIPDWRGLVLSGTSSQPGSRIFIVNDLLHYFNTITTDEKGQFTLPLLELSNFKDTYLFAPNEIDITLDQVSFEFQNDGNPLVLSKDLLKLIERRTITSQLENIYKELKISDTPIPSPFYGYSANSYVLAEYNAFQTVNEIFTEIIEGVRFRKNNENLIQVADQQMNYLDSDPLLLINAQPIADAELLMNLKPERIERIDVLREEVVFNDGIFGGVVNIVSTDSDVPFTFSKHALNMEIANKPEVATARNKNEIDFRSQLFWSRVKDVHLPVRFQASDLEGLYEITLIGMTYEGKSYRWKKYLKIGI